VAAVVPGRAGACVASLLLQHRQRARPTEAAGTADGELRLPGSHEHTHGNSDQHSHGHQHADRDRFGYFDVDRDRCGHCHADCSVYYDSASDNHRHAISNVDRVAIRDSHGIAPPDGIADRDHYPNAGSYEHVYCDGYPRQYRDPLADTDSDPNVHWYEHAESGAESDADIYCYDHPHGHSHADANGDRAQHHRDSEHAKRDADPQRVDSEDWTGFAGHRGG
jgi:hypothetical protein